MRSVNLKKTVIHPTAVVHPWARVGEGVRIGPYSVIGESVEIGAGCRIGPNVLIEGNTKIGRNNKFLHGASIGTPPQDLKYDGEISGLEIGDGNTFREFVTVNTATGDGEATMIGSGCLIMAYAHVAHDCTIGNGTVFGNAATLGGHVEVGDHANIGAYSGVHQFCRVGRHAYIGGYSVVTQDALPYILTVGNRARSYGVNVIGLERGQFAPEAIEALRRAYRILFRSHLSLEAAVERIRTELAGHDEVTRLADFITSSRRGVIR